MASLVIGKPAAAPIEVEIEKLVYGGDGLARVDGQVVLAPYVLPGERVELTAERVKNGLLRGELLKVLQPAPERITPRCEYFADCGGCHYQHADYRLQLSLKESILRETLQRIGRIRYEGEIAIVSAEPWYYRNRLQLHFEERTMGFHKAASHEVRAIAHCEISSPLLNEAISKLQTAIRQPQWPPFLRSLELFTNEAQLQMNILDSARPVAARFFEWCTGFLPSSVPGAIDYAAAGHTFRITRGSFFQVNRFLIDALVREVLGDASGTHAADLYAGVGLFSLPLAQRFSVVDAVERSAPAFRDLEWNAGAANANVRPAKTSAEEFLSALSSAPELVIADPPRAGLGREATERLLELKPARVTVVSCDPSTLARDLAKLLACYRIRRVALVDLFPQTFHFETIAHLELS